MILQDEILDVAVNGNFPTTGFGIAGNAKSYNVLSKKIYTNKVQAVIREVSCNAHDAHVAADQDAQFKVHLPTTLESWFAVRDYGTGLTEQEVREIFCIYFCSTKTASNKAIGCLGLGSKSPFAVADSFTVTSWINGQKTVYSCYKDAKKSPQIARLTQEDSDEPTGIEVKMTVNGRSEEFKREAIRVFQYFDVQPHINVQEVVQEVARLRSSYEIVHPQFSVSKHYGKLLAVMGNVAYKIPTDDDDDKNEDSYDYDSTVKFENIPNIQGFLRFELGELDFDPGREELSMDERTVQMVNDKIALFREELKPLVIAEIETQPTLYKKCVAYEKLNSGALGDLVKLRNVYKLPEATTKFIVYEKNSHRSTVSKSEETEFSIEEDNRIFLKEPRFETRIRQWLKSLGEGRVILLTQEQIDELKIDADAIEVLDAVVPKLEKAARGSAAVTVKTFVWNGSTSRRQAKRGERAQNWDGVTVDIADTTEEKVYVELNSWTMEHTSGWLGSTRDIRDMSEQCRKHGVEIPQVYGLKTAILKTKGFEKGNWIKLQDYMKREMISHAPKKVYSYSGENKALFRALAEVVQVDAVDALNTLISDIHKANYNVEFWTKFGITLDFDLSADTMEQEIFKSFPMLRFVSDYDIRKNPTTIKEYVDGNC